MNREIKFRVWIPEVTDGESTLPAYMSYELVHQKVIAIKTQTKELPLEFGFEHAQLGVYNINDDLAKYGDRLMQYTGLKDKNGKEIYEGDIVKFEVPRYKAIWEVRWVNFGFRLVDGIGYRLLESDKYPKVSERGEIIGNIYENPELLK